ncbi:relaxase/mobilization nuclease domain-containing protein [uncultured Muribaculum sp.]|uniref:relaxase/mobilization nuclease domain-containing protein n=1 Tax=uncultured Muribaculum sp. TaxID=1918613 RepID=UPI00259CFF68|nr:relaxase/mobilization nuclease domain-containing protein [uncultured Muribaculum sp.]
MIAKFKNRIDFAGLVSYANDIKSNEKRGRLLSFQGVCVVSNETIADSFNTHLRHPDSRGRVHHIGQPVKHVSISFSPEDAHLFPDNEQGDRFMAQLVDEWLRGMGITNAQYIVARHFDKTHPHCHLVFSRIDLDGNVISAFNERIRNAKVCKEIKLRHGLTFGNMTGEKVNRDRLRPIQQLRFDIKSAAIAAANSSSSWAEFQHALEAHGIEAAFSINRSTGEIRGISFAKDSYRFAGSKLSKQKLTYGKLVAKFGALPVEEVDVMSTLSTGSRFNSEEGTGKLTVPYQRSNERVGVLQTPSWNQPVTGIDASKTAKPFERVPTNSTPNEPSEVSQIPLSVILDLLAGPAVVQSSGGGGTSNDLDWNDERRRREEARENQYDHKPFKRRR